MEQIAAQQIMNLSFVSARKNSRLKGTYV